VAATQAPSRSDGDADPAKQEQAPSRRNQPHSDLGLNRSKKTEAELVGSSFSSQPIGCLYLKTEVSKNRKNRTKFLVKTECPPEAFPLPFSSSK
jgi:hypothetical protein